MSFLGIGQHGSLWKKCDLGLHRCMYYHIGVVAEHAELAMVTIWNACLNGFDEITICFHWVKCKFHCIRRLLRLHDCDLTW